MKNFIGKLFTVYMKKPYKDEFAVSIYRYSIFVGAMLSVILFISQFIFIFITPINSVRFHNLYLGFSIVMALYSMMLVQIYCKNSDAPSLFERIIVKVLPYIFIIMGIGSSLNNQGFSNQITPYIMAITACTILTYYTVTESFILYLIGGIVFVVSLIITQNDPIILSVFIRNIILMSLFTWTYSIIHYKCYINDFYAKILIKNNDLKQQILIDELKKKNEKIIQNGIITKGMMEISSEILSCGNIDILVQIILEKSIKLMPNAQKGSILICEGDEMIFRACVGYDMELLKQIRLKVEETFQYKSGDLYEPCIVRNIDKFNSNNIANEKVIQFKENEALEAKAVLSSAIMIHNKLYGTINLDNIENENAFCNEDKIVIKHLADQIGIALMNSQLLDDKLKLSRFDGLTKAYNRLYFEELLQRQYDIARKNDYFFTVSIIDLNFLKVVNDTYGHESGDHMIMQFAQTIHTTIRKADLFGRIGGDEFALVFLNTDTEQVHAIMKKIRAKLKDNAIKAGSQEIIITFGYGAAEYPKDAREIKSLLRIADKKMYIDKKESKLKDLA